MRNNVSLDLNSIFGTENQIRVLYRNYLHH